MAAITAFFAQLYPGQEVLTQDCDTGVGHVHHFVDQNDEITIVTEGDQDIHVQVDGISEDRVATVAAAVQQLFTAVKESDYSKFWIDVDLTEVNMATLKRITPPSMLTEGEDPAPVEGAVYCMVDKQLCLWQSLLARAEHVQKNFICFNIDGRVEHYLGTVHQLITHGTQAAPPPLSAFYPHDERADSPMLIS